MKRLWSLMICAVFLAGIGCTTTPQKQLLTEDSLMEAYASAIAQQGFLLEPEAESSSNETAVYVVTGGRQTGKNRIWFSIKKAEEIVTIAKLTFYHPVAKVDDLDSFICLTKALLQVSDAALSGNDQTTDQRLKEIFDSCEQGEPLEKNGVTYAAYRDGTRGMSFVIGYAEDLRADASLDEIATIQGTKPFSFTAEELLSSYGDRIAKARLSVKPLKTSMSGIMELAELPQDGSPKVYALVHCLDITVGWLVLYSTDDGIVQVMLVEKQQGEEYQFIIQSALETALVQVCDPILRQADTEENEEAAQEIASDLYLSEPMEVNGIRYAQLYIGETGMILVTAP